MDAEHCNQDTQAKPENDPGAPKTESNIGPETLPEGFWDDVENNPPEGPEGPIKPPKK